MLTYLHLKTNIEYLNENCGGKKINRLFSNFQIANNSGYVQVDWKRVEKDVNKAKKHLKKRADQAGPELNSFIEDVCMLFKYQQFIVYFVLLCWAKSTECKMFHCSPQSL